MRRWNENKLERKTLDKEEKKETKEREKRKKNKKRKTTPKEIKVPFAGVKNDI